MRCTQKSARFLQARREGTTVFYSIANPKILEACRLMREVLLERLDDGSRLAMGVQGR